LKVVTGFVVDARRLGDVAVAGKRADMNRVGAQRCPNLA
jgi:hypothetical protein